MRPRHSLGADDAPRVRPARTCSRHMRRALSLALALSACSVAVPAAALAATPAPAAATPSPFKADRLSSVPSGLTPNTVATTLAFPDAPVILTWGDVPGAVGYTVEISDTPGFSSIVWKADTVQAIAVPEKLLADGKYWWRVKAVDAAGTVGAYSDVGRFAKSWPNTIGGTKLSAAPGGAGVSHLTLNPYLSWTPVAGAKSYDVQVAAGDQFATSAFTATDVPEAFVTPAAKGALADNGYGWRVRARDANDNPGPWTVATPFTKGWVAPTPVGPADGAATHDLQFVWSPVDGAQEYEIQVSNQLNNWSGNALKIATTTSAASFTPTFSESRGRSLGYGDVWWRVRPKLSGVSGTWSPSRKVVWQAPGVTTATAQLSSSGDTDTGIMPRLQWTPVTGATLYRIDIASDSQFNTLVETHVTESTSWSSREPLPDDQVDTGYWWRVVWGNGPNLDDPDFLPDEDAVDRASFRKQTRVTLGSPANGGVVSEAPLLTWSAVPGVARYEVQLSQDGQFGAASRTATIWGTGAVPGTMRDLERRLPDGSWNWRVRAIDGSGEGQTWSPVGQFTLNSTRPAQREPADGATVVFSPLLRWTAVPGACGYVTQVARDASFAGASTDDEGLRTMQTALVPPRAMITTPGVHYWRVRADYCEGVEGQWSPTRSFRSVFPPDFNLNSIPKSVGYRAQVVVGGQLKNNGAGVAKARLYLERRLYPSDAYRPAGTIKTGVGGRFRFALKMNRSADYRLVWRESATNPQGTAAFGIQVQPRVTFRLASSRVVRRKGLLVTGSIYPRRPALIQMKTSDGWQTVRTVKPTRARFSVAVPTTRFDPGAHRLRLWVPRDAQRRFANTSSRQRGVLVYDRFVIR